MVMPLVMPMTLADLDAIMLLERECFRDPWSRHMYVVDLTQNSLATYLVLRPHSSPGEVSSPTPAPTAQPGRAGKEVSSPTGKEVSEPVLAYGGFWLLMEEAHIATIASHPRWRGCGLAQWLMLALLEAALARGAERSTLEVRVGNLPARRLYEKLGYEVVGIRPRYYRDGEDGLIMTTSSLREPSVQERLAAVRAGTIARLDKCFGELIET